MSELPHIPEELIELKAYQIWEERQLNGREGNPQSDWDEAKQYLKEHRWEVRQWNFFRKITLRWEATLLEKCLESVEFLLRKLAFFTILGRLGKLALIVAVVSFIFGENVRRNNEVFAAWTTITTAHEQFGSGGRTRALEYLNSRPLRFPWIWGTIDLFWDGKECKEKLVFGRRWEREPLVGLSAPKAYLGGIHLCGADLEWANLQQAYLWNANLQGANLGWTNLQGAYLWGANLQGAYLESANLQGADLWAANLQQANLFRVNLQGANLEEANLQSAHLGRSNLQQANLNMANLQKAELYGANLQKAELYGANLRGAYLIEPEKLIPKQIKFTCFWEKAIYKAEWDKEKQIWIAIEPKNTNYIEKLKNDTASNPKYPLDCSWWEKEN